MTTVDAYFDGGYADGKLLPCELPLPHTLQVAKPARVTLSSPLIDPVHDTGPEMVTYVFTGVALIAATGTIRRAIYQVWQP